MAKNQIDPCLFVIFGATGDLTRRKLLPALYQLARRNLLHGCHILGVSRSGEMNDEAFRALALEVVNSAETDGPEAAGAWCYDCVHYRSIGDGTKENFQNLASEIEALEKRCELPGNRIFYLALPPQSFAPTIEGIGESGLNESSGWTRIIVEKPFGHDLSSSKELDGLLHRFFDETEIYRIDHYLGKETVQNLLVLRFANPIFESVWNRDRIDNVQITVAEELGVEKRAAYYEQIGALRDMVQNHLTQVLTLVAMEMPAAMDAESIRDEKAKVLRSIAPLRRENVVFGQYTAGEIDGKSEPAYVDEPGVAPDSQTETAVAIKIEIANWRWQGVPFYLRTGKRMARRVSKIAIIFKRAPVTVFQPFGSECNLRSNALVMTLQPDEGLMLQFGVKVPGQPIVLASQNLDFRYAEAFSRIADAYETLLLDILSGDQTLFVRTDWVESSWKLYDPLLQHRPEMHKYPAGSWGPPEAQRLLASQDCEWFPV